MTLSLGLRSSFGRKAIVLGFRRGGLTLSLGLCGSFRRQAIVLGFRRSGLTLSLGLCGSFRRQAILLSLRRGGLTLSRGLRRSFRRQAILLGLRRDGLTLSLALPHRFLPQALQPPAEQAAENVNSQHQQRDFQPQPGLSRQNFQRRHDQADHEGDRAPDRPALEPAAARCVRIGGPADDDTRQGHGEQPPWKIGNDIEHASPALFHEKFDAPVLRPPLRRIVGGDGLGLAVSRRSDARRLDTGTDDDVDDRLGAAPGQIDVKVVIADVVGVT